MDNRFDKLSVSNGVTYVAGLGFISPNNDRQTIEGINKISNIISASIIVYFFCQKLFIMPATYLAGLLGFEISINRFTGMIMTSSASRAMIKFIAGASALAICTLIIYLLAMRRSHLRHVFSKPSHGTFAIALPIIISAGLLGSFLTGLFSNGIQFFGIVLSESFIYTIDSSVTDTIFRICLMLFFVAMQEILFHGVILFSLRKFGDGFAIIASSIVFSLFQNGIPEIISSFILGIVIAYFVVRSGSIYVAIAGRCSLALLYYVFAYLKVCLSGHISSAAIYLICIVFICISLIAFSVFARHDENAFTLKPSESSISLRSKLARFSTTLLFLIFVGMVALNAINNIQIIG